jgi:DnaJ-class molecular chaperone
MGDLPSMGESGSETGYVDFFEILGLQPDCKQGEVRHSYKKTMKQLVMEIARTEITEDRRNTYLLRMAQLNAAFYVLRDKDRRPEYVEAREKVMALESAWREAADGAKAEAEGLRREFDRMFRDFLSTYMEDLMLEAGRDRDCVETSNWDPYHERHASRVLRHYRQQLYHEIHERLPFYDITKPEIDWDERSKAAAALLDGKGA